MKNILLVLLIIGTSITQIACKKTKSGEFFITNGTSQNLDVHSCAIVRSNNSTSENCLDDVVVPGQTLSLRRITVTDKTAISSVFSKLEISKAGTVCKKDPFDKGLWDKNDTEKKDEYTLKVDDSFF